MKKILCLLLMLSLDAGAAEVGGVTVNDTVHMGNSDLVLNGAGVRSKFVFDLYVVGLYLKNRKHDALDVYTDPGEKRISLQILTDINAEDLIYNFDKAINKNSSADELAEIKTEQHEFGIVFHKLGRVKRGDFILMDYMPGVGTQVTINGALRGTIKGAAFYTALLKIWLGEKAADEELKQKLLGGK